MENCRIYIDQYNHFYREGINCLEKKQYDEAIKKLRLSALALLKCAKNSDNIDYKKQLQERANELQSKIDKLCNLNVEKEYKENCQVSNPTIDNQRNIADGKNNKFVSIKDTGVSLDDICGMEKEKAFLIRLIKRLKHPETVSSYLKQGEVVSGGLLLYGVPGTGKTMFAKAIAHETNADFYYVKSSDLITPYSGESDQNITKLFEEAKQNKFSIIFFDEFDSLGAKRSGKNMNFDNRTVNTLLQEIDGFNKCSNVFVVAATNKPWLLDSGISRRFPFKFCVPLPDYEARLEMIKQNLEKVDYSEIDIDDLAKKLENYSGSDVHHLCSQMLEYACDRSIDYAVENDLKYYEPNEKVITSEDLSRAMEIVHSSVNEKDLSEIDKYNEQFI